MQLKLPIRTASCFGRNRCGTSAVEFAIIGPVFVLLVFGIACFGLLFATWSAVQQLAAEAARASVAGLDTAERDQLARNYIVTSLPAYGLLEPTKLTVLTTAKATSFQVAVTYDMSQSVVYQLSKLVPLPSPIVRRAATITNGGF